MQNHATSRERRAETNSQEAHPRESSSRRTRLSERRGLARPITRLANWFEASIARASPLGDPVFYDPSDFSWVSRVEREWEAMRDELSGLMGRHEELASFHEIAKQVEKISNDDTWKTFFLAGYGLDSARARAVCPNTARIVKEIPGMKTAMFSILAPGKHIPPHRGPYNGVLRYHLGLIVPREKERCRIEVAGRTRHWSEGRSLIFDDTYVHQVWNDTDEYRAILFVDFLRPLRPPMRQINEAIVKVASYSPPLRQAAKRQAAWEDRFFGGR